MKKSAIAIFLVVSGTAIFAQDQLTNANINTTIAHASSNSQSDHVLATKRNSVGNYNAYASTQVNVPFQVTHQFSQQHPHAVNAQWYNAPDGLFRADYRKGTEDVTVYYSESGQGFLVVSPVSQNQVPKSIVIKAKNRYGINMYDITRVRAVNGADLYQVRIIENGQLRAELIGADGNAVVEVLRSESGNAAMSDQNDSTYSSKKAKD